MKLDELKYIVGGISTWWSNMAVTDGFDIRRFINDRRMCEGNNLYDFLYGD